MRLPSPLFFILVASTFFTHTALARDEVDVWTLLTASSFSSCAAPCLSDLVYAARELLFFKETIHHFDQLCKTYSNASLCVSSQEVVCNHTSSFSITSDTLNALCEKRSDSFTKQLPCLEKNVDSVLQSCDSSCLFTAAVSDISRRESVRDLAKTGGNGAALLKELGKLCPATSCFISCLSKKIDEKCPPAGNEIASALLRPFYVEAEMILSSDKMLEMLTSLPLTCLPFVDEGLLEEIKDGSFYVEESLADDKIVNVLVHKLVKFHGGMIEGSGEAEETKERPDIEEEHKRKEIIEEVEMELKDKEIRLVQKETSISTLIAAAGVPSCSSACLSDLLFAAEKLIRFNDTIHDFEHLCMTYEDARLCVAQQEIECIHESSFTVGVSMLEAMCNEKKEEFKDHLSCIAPHVDVTLRQCDLSCQFMDSINQLLQSEVIMEVSGAGGDRSVLYQELAPVCPALGCAVSCVSRTLNRDCDPAGSEIAVALLRPFAVLTQFLIEVGPSALEEAKASIPSTCSYLLSLTDLADVAAGLEHDDWATPVEAAILAQEEASVAELEKISRLGEKGKELEDEEHAEGYGHDEPILHRGRRVRP